MTSERFLLGPRFSERGEDSRDAGAASRPWPGWFSAARPMVAAVLFGMANVTEPLWGASVPIGFAETVIPGPRAGQWDDAVGISFEGNGRMYVWERSGRIWIREPSGGSFSLLLDISEEVGAWEDHGFVGFATDPAFRSNGYIYLLYAVDRHHLLHFGTANYDPTENQYNAATIGRLTRYTCRAADGFRSVDPASRLVLIGQTRQTGFAILSYTHGIGSLVFGEDGTLLVSAGDGATADTVDAGGAISRSYAPVGLADGIIKPKEDIGAFRSQLVDSLNGKILRIDPATGNGVPSNPFYDAGSPRSARSRVWALGLRNPYRMSLRPGTGSSLPADKRPGVLYVGDVGWNTREFLEVVTGPRLNFGWPLYEGLDLEPRYATNATVFNTDAPNPLYPNSGCRRYFSFRELLKEDTLVASAQPPFVNPCNSSQRIPSSIPQFVRTRQVLDWHHENPITRTGTYGTGGNAQVVRLSATDSPVSGTEFRGNCAVGGIWYTGTTFPAEYRNTYFFADWGQGVIKNLTFDQNHKPIALKGFLSSAGAVACMAQHPSDGSLYYVSYTYGDSGTIRRIYYAGNRTPVAFASLDRSYGPSPLSVRFSSNGSADPDGHPISFSWNFGDGSAPSVQADPIHTFSVASGAPTQFTVRLTVTDTGGLSASTNMTVSVNNTPPIVALLSPVDGNQFSVAQATTVNLNAQASDAEFATNRLLYLWQTLLHHNEHDHVVAVSTNRLATTVLEPIGCDGLNIYYYRVVLTVTDPAGLSTSHEAKLFPQCPTADTPPTISDIADQTVVQDQATAPLAFTVRDNETSAANLQVSGRSSNTGLVRNASILFDGSGSNRTVTVTPESGQVGITTISVTVNDGPFTVMDTFRLSVHAAAPGTRTFSSTAGLGLPDVGAASPYPSTLQVGGVGGVISRLNVELRSMTHTYPGDLDMLLVAPDGRKALFFSDVGAGGNLNAVTLTFSDAAPAPLTESGQIVAGTYRPSNVGEGDSFLSPAPPGPYSAALSTFNGMTPSGIWSLYAMDDGAGDGGAIGSWALTITTISTGPQAPTISDLANQSVSINTPTAPIAFVVDDADTPAAELVVAGSSSNPTLVPNGNLSFAGTGNSRTVTARPAAGQTGTTTITVTVSDGARVASDAFVLTVGTLLTGSRSFTNRTAIVIPSLGNATPYPSLLEVTGVIGIPTDVTVTLEDLTHSYPGDVDVLLVGPAGQQALILSDAGGTADLTDVTVTFSDKASAWLTENEAITPGTYLPTDLDPSADPDLFPPPAPSGPHPSPLSVFDGVDANGTWSLYVVDDGAGDQGRIGGWILNIETTAPPVLNLVGRDTQGRVSLRLDAPPGQYTIEASDDLTSWSPLGSVSADPGMNLFTDTGATLRQQRFYRVLQGP